MANNNNNDNNHPPHTQVFTCSEVTLTSCTKHDQTTTFVYPYT